MSDEQPDIAEFIDPVIPKLQPAKRMSLIFVFNTEEELDHIVHAMRQNIKEDSEIEMIAALSEKTAEILALFEEKEDDHVDGAGERTERDLNPADLGS